MEKFVKIVFKDRTSTHLSLKKWESIVQDQANLVPYRLDGEKEWLGHTLNKVDVMYSEYDEEYSKKTNKPEFDYYRDKSRDVIVQMPRGTLPADPSKFDKVG